MQAIFKLIFHFFTTVVSYHLLRYTLLIIVSHLVKCGIFVETFASQISNFQASRNSLKVSYVMFREQQI